MPEQASPSARLSEDVDGGKARHAAQAVRQIDRKAHVAGPQRIVTAPELLARLAALGDGRHRKCPRALEPNRVRRAAMQLEECVAVAAGAVTEIGALCARTSRPG